MAARSYAQHKQQREQRYGNRDHSPKEQPAPRDRHVQPGQHRRGGLLASTCSSSTSLLEGVAHAGPRLMLNRARLHFSHGDDHLGMTG